MSEHDSVLDIIRHKNAQPLVIDPARAALLVIDVQRYFVHPGYPFSQVLDSLASGVTAGYFARVKSAVLPNIQRLQQAFRAVNGPIFYTATGTALGDGRDLPGWLRNFDQLGLMLLGKRVWPRSDDESWRVEDIVAPWPGELVLLKGSSGPFNSTGLEATLRHLSLTTLVVTGLTTDVCVTQTAREAADRGFSVVIAEDACTTLSEEMHRGALAAFGLAFGSVRCTSDVIAALEPAVAEV
jgi:nicotinamidase-related amidase